MIVPVPCASMYEIESALDIGHCKCLGDRVGLARNAWREITDLAGAVIVDC